MSRSSKKRRAAKRRRQHAARSGRPTGTRNARRDRSAPDVDQIIRAAAQSARADAAHHEELLDHLDALAADGLPVLAAAVRRLDAVLGALWDNGWTPVDVVQVTVRHLTGAHVAAARAAVVRDGQARARSGHPPHARWQAQLDVVASGTTSSRSRSAGSDVRVVVGLLGLLTHLPVVARTMPGPAETAATMTDAASTAGMDQRMLGRVRGLLAKAESTEFDEEAEALTAKAQELIARHAIAEALLHTPDDVGDPSVRRVPVDNPYPDAKAALLSVIADANRCRAVHSPDLGWVTVFGYDGDLDAVELLNASLLAQATSAMARHGSRRGLDGRSTTRSFRRSFLFGFAERIGQRLRDATDGQVRATASAETHLLPVLAARDDRLSDAVGAAFDRLEHRTTSITNSTGWSAGQAAAELADLGVQRPNLDRAR